MAGGTALGHHWRQFVQSRVQLSLTALLEYPPVWRRSPAQPLPPLGFSTCHPCRTVGFPRCLCRHSAAIPTRTALDVLATLLLTAGCCLRVLLCVCSCFAGARHSGGHASSSSSSAGTSTCSFAAARCSMVLTLTVMGMCYPVLTCAGPMCTCDDDCLSNKCLVLQDHRK